MVSDENQHESANGDAEEGGSAGNDRAQVAIGAFLILVVGAIAFGTASLGLPYQLDEQRLLVEDTALHSPWTILQASDDAQLRPLAALSLAVNWLMGSGTPWVFHFTNLLLHLSNGVLVYLVCRRLLGEGTREAVSMVAGMLFVAHPAMTQAVNHLSNRSVLLCATFLLLSVVLYLRATQDEARTSYTTLALSVVFFALAWATEATAWIVPVLILGLDSALRGTANIRSRLVTQSPYWALLAVLLVMHFGVRVAQGDSLFQGVGALTQARAVDSFLAATFFPLNLLVEHAPYVSELSGIPILWGILVVAGLVLTRFAALPGVAVLWYLVAVVAPGLFLSDPSFQEARLYIPLAGLVFIAPWVIQAVMNPVARLPVGGLCALLILGEVALTSMRNNQWRSEAELWIDANEACPECYEPMERIGYLHLGQGERTLRRLAGSPAGVDAKAISDEAGEHFSLAEEFFTSATSHEHATALAWKGLAGTLNYLGDKDGAYDALESSLSMDPTDAQTMRLIASLALERAEQSDDPRDVRVAVDYFRSATKLATLPGGITVRYARLLKEMGDVQTSAAILSGIEGLDASPEGTQLMDEVAEIVQVMHVLENTMAEGSQANPGHPDLLLIRARQLHLEGHYMLSNYLLLELSRMGRLNEDTWMLLGINSAKMRGLETFIAEWPDALGTGESGAQWQKLAEACFAANMWAGAQVVYQHLYDSGDLESSPLIVLANVAMAQQDFARASAYLRAAAEADDADPAPWLGLTDLALASGQVDVARALIVEAENRGASEADLAARRELAGATAQSDEPDPLGLQREIIR